MRYKIIDIGRDADASAIVAALAKHKTVESIVKSMDVSDASDDLIQDIYMQLLEDPKTVDLYLKRELQFYIVGIARNSVFSNTSRYYTRYKKFTELNNGEFEEDEEQDQC